MWCAALSPGCGCALRRPDLEELTTVFRSPRRRDCDERLLVLTAVGVAASVAHADSEFLLQVPGPDAPHAIRHLLQYEAENRAPPPPPPPPREIGRAHV